MAADGVAGSIEDAMRIAHQDLMDARCKRAMQIGIAAYVLNIIEPWLDYHNPSLVVIQLVPACFVAITFSLYLTPVGKRHSLALVTAGLLFAAAGFEAVVAKQRAFQTAYSDGFPVLFAFYSVLIPTTLLNTSLVGIGLILVLSVPEAVITHDITRIVNGVIANATTFGILLSGRHIANTSWRREFEASHAQLNFIAAVSHDFRSALTSICLFADQLA
jgi:hypothetical protein